MEAARCSTGEQKALLIGLVLAHAGLTRTVSGMAPIMLLDEIAAHLDPLRRAALFDRVDAVGGQAFMTGTDRALFDALGERAQYFRVENGTLEGEADNP
jgi:DNA replication and repair protein RecF